MAARSSSWYQSAQLRARRETSVTSSIPTLPVPTSVKRRWKPVRWLLLTPDLPRSSSMTTMRSSGQPQPRARAASWLSSYTL